MLRLGKLEIQLVSKYKPITIILIYNIVILKNTFFCFITKLYFFLIIQGQIGPAIALCFVGYASCDPFLTLAILSIGLGVNGAIYSGYVANHIDISPNYVCILVAMTTFIATGIGFIAPVLASYALYGEVRIKSLFYNY